jgi:hypothetical protein
VCGRAVEKRLRQREAMSSRREHSS